jgi:hypothetical protein
MTPVKKSLGLLSSIFGLSIEKVNFFPGILSLALVFCWCGQSVLAAEPPSQPPSSVVAAVRQDVSQRTRIPANRFQVRSTHAHTWTDGCLGLARPGEMCTQAMVEGWQVILTDNQKTWTYRTDATGRVIRLEP